MRIVNAVRNGISILSMKYKENSIDENSIDEDRDRDKEKK